MAATGLLLACGLWQCGSALLTSSRLADGAVKDFHDRLNAGEFGRIYDEAHVDFKTATKKEDWVALSKAIHTKLGNAGESKMQNLNVRATTSGKFTFVAYRTQFTGGTAVESFTWRVSDGQLVLVGYNISSNELILK